MTSQPPRPPAAVCIAARIVPARLVVLETPPGAKAIAWPLLVIDKCPWTPPFTAGHGHAHAICEPGQRWVRLAPCNRRPYVLKIAGMP